MLPFWPATRRRARVLTPLALIVVACGDGPTMPSNAIASISVSPGTVSLTALGATAQLTATGRSATGSDVSLTNLVWSSSNESVARVNTSGLVTAVADGTATIMATASDKTASATVVVQQVAASVSVTPDVVRLTRVGETVQLTASAVDSNGHLIDDRATWASTDERVARVTEAGLVSAVGAGTVTITARVRGIPGTALAIVDIQVIIATIATGFDHSCAVSTAGTAYCWGANSFGQLGTGSTARSLEPVPVHGALQFDSVSAGTGHTCGVTRNGEGYCWGNSDRGQAGDGGLAVRLAPARVAGGHLFYSIEAGRAHTCALTRQNSVYCWGWGSNGEFGNGILGSRSVPDSVFTTARYRMVKGTTHTLCAVRLTGEIDCWGRNNTGQVGDGTVTCTSLSASCFDDRALPTRVQSAAAFNSVSSGGRIINGFGGGTSCGITAASIAFCWGQNTNGQIGDDSRTPRLIPMMVSGNHTWRSIHVGSTTVCGVTVNNIGHCWGYNGTGVLGDGTTIDRLLPTPVAGGIPFSRITVGYDHACGLSITGEVYCWGANSNGQLGIGSTTASPSPVRVTFPK